MSDSDGDLKEFLLKLDDALQTLDNLRRAGMETADRLQKAEMDEEVDDSSVVKVEEHRTVVIKSEPSYEDPQEIFMQQEEQDAEKRAEHFRKLGNEAFRRKDYEEALSFYSKAIEHVQDSPVLYNNRSLCYMKLHLYKHSIFECDLVLNKIDKKNLRAWLYRAMAYYWIGDENLFESCVKMTKKNNPKEVGYIEKFIKDFKNLQ